MVASGDGGLSDVFVMDVDGTDFRNLTRSPTVTEGQPSWSPDRARLALVTFETEGISIMGADGAGRRALLPPVRPGERTVSHPQWSPSGSDLVFAMGLPSDQNARRLWLIDAQGGAPVRLTEGVPGADDLPGSWLPEGRILFVRLWPSGVGAPRSEIRSVDPGSGRETFIREVPGGGIVTPPVASPDGAWIAFTVWRMESQETDIMVMRADGSELRTFFPTAAGESDPAWRSDSRSLVYLVDERIRWLRLDGSEGGGIQTPRSARDLAASK